jgi:S-adenosylmethionine/arginine decarboxylase-like enzyme
MLILLFLCQCYFPVVEVNANAILIVTETHLMAHAYPNSFQVDI